MKKRKLTARLLTILLAGTLLSECPAEAYAVADTSVAATQLNGAVAEAASEDANVSTAGDHNAGDNSFWSDSGSTLGEAAEEYLAGLPHEHPHEDEQADIQIGKTEDGIVSERNAPGDLGASSNIKLSVATPGNLAAADDSATNIDLSSFKTSAIGSSDLTPSGDGMTDAVETDGETISAEDTDNELTDYLRPAIQPLNTNLAATKALTAGLSTVRLAAAQTTNYSYPVGSNIIRALSLSASYNGSNIIISFNYNINSAYNIWNIYFGWSGELYAIKAYGAGTNVSNWDSKTSCSFGTVTHSSVSHTMSTATVSGTITITNPSGLKSWYESNNHAFWFNTYDSGSGPTVSISCSDQNPMNISGLSTALAYGTCSHTYAYASVNASTHKYYCTKCGYTVSTGSHNSNTADTASSPGYTVHKCSLCGYAGSVTANQYAVALDQTDATTKGTASVTATYAAAMPAITLPQRTGYAFKGYYTGQNGGGTQYYTETGASARTYGIAGNTTLYAKWEKRYTVTTTEVRKNEFAFKGT